MPPGCCLPPSQALASEAAARSAHAVSAAARPLQSSLLDTLLPDLMAGLVEVALSRPNDPCQVGFCVVTTPAVVVVAAVVVMMVVWC